MSEILYAEGPDLPRVVARIAAEHGSGARLLTVSKPRRGGMFGFFSREICAVSYELTDRDERSEPSPSAPPAVPVPPVVPAPPADVPPAASGPTSLLDLIDEADSADGPVPSGPSPVASTGPAPDDFAAVLAAVRPRLGIPASPAAPAVPATAPTATAPTATASPLVPTPPARLIDAVPMQAPLLPARARLGMLAELRDVGVPVPLTPEAGETSLYRAVEQVIEQLPPAPLPPRRVGEILALVGPRDEALRIATTVARQMFIPAESICLVDPSAGLRSSALLGPRDAARHAQQVRAGDLPSIMVIDLGADDVLVDGQSSWCAQVLAAVRPTAVWAVVDASRKIEDVRLELSRLGALDGLAVFGLARTTSPATVWDLDLPVALLDGRPATRGAWAALLFDVLRPSSSGPDRSPSSAPHLDRENTCSGVQ